MLRTKVKSTFMTLANALGVVIISPAVVFAQAGEIQKGIDGATPPDADSSVGIFDEGGLFERITSTLLLLVGALSVVMLVVGGIRYVVSAGDQNAVQGAKNTILYAIVGIVVAFLAFTAVQFVVDQLSAS